MSRLTTCNGRTHATEQLWCAVSARTSKLLLEAARNARAHSGTTIVLALVAAAMMLATLLTAGRAAATEAEIVSSVDGAGSRLIEVTITEPSPGLNSSAVSRVLSLDNVEWVLALGPARDVRSIQLASRINVAARTLLTDLPPGVDVTAGRAPQAGEAIVTSDAQRRLQLEYPVGAISDGAHTYSVVGSFEATGLIDTLGRLVLTGVNPEVPEHATLIYVLADQANNVAGIVDAIRAVADVPAEYVVVKTSDTLIELGNVVNGSIGELSRQLAAGAIIAGVVLVALTMTLALTSRRRDFGRRRALGATRSALVALVLLEVGVPVIIGALVGLGAMVGLAVGFGVAIPPPAFIAAAFGLTCIAGLVAAIPPTVWAARQDPLKILRVP